MSSSTVDNEEGPAAKKARIEEPRPMPKFKRGDLAVVKVYEEYGEVGMYAVVKVTTVSWSSEDGFWVCGGMVWGTKIFLKAPESGVRSDESAACPW